MNPADYEDALVHKKAPGTIGQDTAACGVTRDDDPLALIAILDAAVTCDLCRDGRPAPTEAEHTITISRNWWHDHRDRCDDQGCRDVVPQRLTKTTATVSLTSDQLDDMEKDARWYAESGRHLDPEVARVLTPMARRALARIEKHRAELHERA